MTEYESLDDNEVEIAARPAHSIPRTSKQNIVQVIYKRAWKDIEPKLAVGLLSGAIATAVIAEAAVLGFPLDPGAAALVTTLLAFIGGYFKSSTAKETFEGSPEN